MCNPTDAIASKNWVKIRALGVTVSKVYIYCCWSISIIPLSKIEPTTELCLLDHPDEICDRLTLVLNVMLDSRWPVKTFKVKLSYAQYITRG